MERQRRSSVRLIMSGAVARTPNVRDGIGGGQFDAQNGAAIGTILKPDATSVLLDDSVTSA
jgi:hypothetical protein